VPSGFKERYEGFMAIALREARRSLREGNKGFGAVLIKDSRVLGRAHDTEVTESDPIAHAEIKLIRSVARRGIGVEFEGSILVSTHEPCPMCTGAIIWAGISEVIYGTSIQDSRRAGRTMVNMGCKEIIANGPSRTKVIGGVLSDQCSRLYDSSVRELVRKFRVGGPASWSDAGRELTKKRITWFIQNRNRINATLRGSDIEKAYQLILMKIDVDKTQAPIEEESGRRLVFHSENQCPALNACEILGLDPREVCKLYSEEATDALIKSLNPRLKFSRDYSRLRPTSPFCREIIELQQP
jgi:tRNA(Arg) A34 adenosine deaminase TadA